MNSSSFNPTVILEARARHNVAYVLIGGYAAVLQGSGCQPSISTSCLTGPRTIWPTSPQFSRGSTRVSKLQKPGHFRFSASAESLQGVNILNLTTRFGDLDLAFEPAGFATGFERLTDDARPMTIGGFTVLVASLDDVITSKEAAGRDKDFEALPRLITLRNQQHNQDRSAD